LKRLPSVFFGSCISEVKDLSANDDGTDDGGGKFAFIILDDLLSTTDQHFVVMGRSMKKLFVLALGQKNEAGDEELVDIDKPPWSLQKKKEIKPSVKEYVNEIKRCSAVDENPPKYSSWKAHACVAWLAEHPITGDAA
jgi:hypothetical protein